ncbi:MAG: GPW/gp25 family protein [Thermoanaerobaculia bacterium]
MRMYRTLEFSHPDLDDESPGLHVSPTGGVTMTSNQAAVRQAILLLLTTRNGERVMRPAYGCSLNRLMFWPNDDTTAGLAIHYVRQAIERFEPRVEITEIDAGRNPFEPARLDIRLEYRVRATRRVDEIAISMSLTGEES